MRANAGSEGRLVLVVQKLATTIHRQKERTMKSLKTLGIAIALMLVFAFVAFADCDPGQMSTPPCVGAQITPDDPVAPANPSQSFNPGNPNVIEISVTTLDVLLTALSIF
jgi:hypothetical protein